METHEQAKHIVDGLAVAITLGSLMEFLPALASLLSIIWMGIRIYETDTVQKILGKKPRSF